MSFESADGSLINSDDQATVYRPFSEEPLAEGVLLNNDYRIIRVLGQGMTGITYLADHLHLRKQCAVKEYFPKHYASRLADGKTVKFNFDDPEPFVEKFLGEGRRLAQSDINHPSIVTVHNAFFVNQTAYIVMEYEKGKTVNELINAYSGRVPEPVLLKVLEDISAGLEFIHAKNMIHRDIKPANICIRAPDNTQLSDPSEFQAVLIDFGSARDYEEASEMTQAFTPSFAAPEQYPDEATQSTIEEGPYTDIYCMSATLYKAMFGSSPVSALDRKASRESSSQDLLEQLSQTDIIKNAPYSEALKELVFSGLEFDLKKRPATIQQWLSPYHAVLFPDLRAESQSDKRYGMIAFIAILVCLAVMTVYLLIIKTEGSKIENSGSSESFQVAIPPATGLSTEEVQQRQAVEEVRHNMSMRFNAFLVLCKEVDLVKEELEISQKSLQTFAEQASDQLKATLQQSITDYEASLDERKISAAYQLYQLYEDQKDNKEILVSLLKEKIKAAEKNLEQENNELLNIALAAFLQAEKVPQNVSEKFFYQHLEHRLWQK